MTEVPFRAPKIHDSCWVAPTAFVSGDVTLEADVSVWPGASIRGDMEPIVVKRGTNIQDGAVLHTSYGFPLTLAEKVTVGHGAVVHSATSIGEGTLVGMNAVVLDGAVVGKGCLIAAGAVVTPGTDIPDHSLVAGVPGKVLKTDERLYDMNMHNHESYLKLKEWYKAGKVPVHEGR
ncbi:MAG: gamma carbonic anhydrase family protein [Euryarchaeota archaeon]|nr:gamma carbonic anhydrase family protein [Euryarchaeota archaeon]